MFSIPSDVLALLALMFTIAGSVWGLAWWLSGRFNGFYKKIDEVGNMILDKLEYHERHDDSRFSSVNNDLWAIRLRNAERDGTPIAPRNISQRAPAI